MATLINKRKSTAVSRETQEYSRNRYISSSNHWIIYSTSCWKDWRQSHWITVPRIQLDRVPHLGSSVQNGRISPEPTVTDTLRNRSANIPERWHREPRTKRGSLPEWSPFEVEFSACRASNPTDSDPDEASHSYIPDKRGCPEFIGGRMTIHYLISNRIVFSHTNWFWQLLEWLGE